MKNRETMRGIRRIFDATLFGAIIMSFGGTALAAASAPAVARIEFKERDAKGTLDSSDDSLKTVTMSTGFSAYRVAVDAKGNAYVTDPEMDKIYVYNSNGRLVAMHSASVPRGVTIKSDGTVYTNGMLTDVEADSNGYMYALDRSGGTVSVLDRDGNVLQVLNVGDLNVERYDTDPDTSLALRIRTRHTLTSASGIAIDNDNGDIYVAYSEYVDYLTNSTASPGCAVYGQYNYIVDTTASTLYSGTTPDYIYWCGVGSRNVVAVINKDNGMVKRKIGLDPYVASSTYLGDGVQLRPQGMSLDKDKDGNVRLYVATNGGIKVYDAAEGTVLTPMNAGVYDTAAGSVDTAQDGRFADGVYMDIVFDSVNRRVFATSGNSVTVYGIDVYSVPPNTPPTAPKPDAPANRFYIRSRTPLLSILNSSDNEGDRLTYGFDIVDSIGNSATPNASLIAEDPSGKTSMAISSPLNDNTLYRWRAQSFDGIAFSSWSDERWDETNHLWVKDPTLEREFCVNENNDNPAIPAAIAPVNEPASPFGSYLTWNQSTDPDCYDTVVYVVEVSGDASFPAYLASSSLAGTSIRLGDLVTNLVNGNTYYWRVKAVDYYDGKPNGTASAYSSGSFRYATTVVRFESDQSDTKVYIDGNYGYLGRLLGTAGPAKPLEVQNINPGSHFVTFVKAGYEPYNTIIDVKYPLLDGDVKDPLLVDGAVLAVSATSAKWITASKITPAATSSGLLDMGAGKAAPFVVDYNNDRLKDILIGDADGNVYLYLSEEQQQGDGSKEAVLVSRGAVQNVKVASRAVPFVVDYNDDGKKDLLSGSGDGLIYLYLNTGTDDAPAFAAPGTIKDKNGNDLDVGTNSAPVVVDYNNDGKKDLVVGSSDGTLVLYINKATGTIADASPEFDAAVAIKVDNSELNIGLNVSSKAFFTDWNSDGKKDLIVGGSTVNLFLNVGTDEAPDFRSIAGLQQWIIEKRRERGNREFLQYIGYTQDLGDLTSGHGDASPFVVDWEGTSARDVVVGDGMGKVVKYVTVGGAQ